MIRAKSVGFAYKSILCSNAGAVDDNGYISFKPLASDGRIVLKDKREYAVRRENYHHYLGLLESQTNYY